jgi:hypothetical protein
MMTSLTGWNAGPGAEPTQREEGLISNYIIGVLPLKRAKAVERRLLNDTAFHRRVGNSLRLQSIISRIVLPQWKKSGRRVGKVDYPPGPTDRYESLLKAAISQPGEHSLDQCLERFRRDVKEHGRLGRSAVEAVRRLKPDRHLTTPEADALVLHIAGAMRGEIDEIAGLLMGLDEERLARMVRKKGEHPLNWASEQLTVFKARIGDRGRDWTVDYPAWSEDDREVVVRVGRDAKMEAIQRDRASGKINARLAWWLLDMRAMVVVSRQFWADMVYGEIVERLEGLEAAGCGPTDPYGPDADATASSEWRGLHAARHRRMGVFTRHVLRAAGEEEMVRMMVERPEEYRRRAEMVSA